MSVNHNWFKVRNSTFLFSLPVVSHCWPRLRWSFFCQVWCSHTHTHTSVDFRVCVSFIRTGEKNGHSTIGMWVRLARPAEPYKPCSIAETERGGWCGVRVFSNILSRKEYNWETGARVSFHQRHERQTGISESAARRQVSGKLTTLF